MAKKMFVYILTNKINTVLYVGVTNNLLRRLSEHRTGAFTTFTGKYNVCKLVYYEIIYGPMAAIKREKQLKAGSRAKKVALVKEHNPEWRDLADPSSQATLATVRWDSVN